MPAGPLLNISFFKIGFACIQLQVKGFTVAFFGNGLDTLVVDTGCRIFGLSLVVLAFLVELGEFVGICLKRLYLIFHICRVLSYRGITHSLLISRDRFSALVLDNFKITLNAVANHARLAGRLIRTFGKLNSEITRKIGTNVFDLRNNAQTIGA